MDWLGTLYYTLGAMEIACVTMVLVATCNTWTIANSIIHPSKSFSSWYALCAYYVVVSMCGL